MVGTQAAPPVLGSGNLLSTHQSSLEASVACSLLHQSHQDRLRSVFQYLRQCSKTLLVRSCYLPAFDTAAANGAPAVCPIPASKMGCWMPSSWVTEVVIDIVRSSVGFWCRSWYRKHEAIAELNTQMNRARMSGLWKDGNGHSEVLVSI